LASLDFELPERGQTYYFTIPRGHVVISGRPVNGQLLQRLTNFARLLALVVAALCSWWLIRKATHTRRGHIVVGVGLCIAGLILLLFGVLPIFAVAMLLGGVLVAAGRWRESAGVVRPA